MQDGRVWHRGETRESAKKRIRDVAAEAYDWANEPFCCDPRDLADGLGLHPCPIRSVTAFVSGKRLHYPEHLTRSQRGPGIYRLVAALLLPEGPVDSLLRELILPEPIARTASFCELERLQPHAPLALVRDIFMSHRSVSGEMAIPPRA